MKKEINYYVIGGQYEWYCHGGAATLAGAKRLASANMEYWDNWQGWHYPAVYAAANTHDVVSQFYGAGRAPLPGAVPVATRRDGERWTNGGEF